MLLLKLNTFSLLTLHAVFQHTPTVFSLFQMWAVTSHGINLQVQLGVHSRGTHCSYLIITHFLYSSLASLPQCTEKCVGNYKRKKNTTILLATIRKASDLHIASDTRTPPTCYPTYWFWIYAKYIRARARVLQHSTSPPPFSTSIAPSLLQQWCRVLQSTYFLCFIINPC